MTVRPAHPANLDLPAPRRCFVRDHDLFAHAPLERG